MNYGTDRTTTFEIVNDLDADGGLNILINDTYDVKNTLSSRNFTLGSNLARNTWHKVRIEWYAPDNFLNDVVKVWINDELKGTRSSWEDYWDYIGSPTARAANRTFYRMNRAPSYFDSSFVNANAQGFYIDDLCYRVYSSSAPATTLDSYRTSFEN
jgi:hypothetical protein